MSGLAKHVATVLAGLWLGFTPACPALAEAATVPAQFDDHLFTIVTRPTALAFTPDGRMLITLKNGVLRVHEDGTLLPAPSLDRSSVTCSDGERGLLGVAVDPAFATNNFIYLYYTFKKFGVCDTSGPSTPVNRVSRFVLGDDDTVSIASEVVLIDNIPSPNGIHNAGDLNFGKDGLLYVSVGDGGCDFRGDSGCHLLNDAARDMGALTGKILRVTRDGDIPPGNPYQGPATARCNLIGSTDVTRTCSEIFAWGLRNPFRFAFDPNAAGTRFYVNDVGAGAWEEVDEGAAAADYGWNVREGPCARGSDTNCGAPPVGMTNPLHAYHHNTGCHAVTLGAFVPVGIWPLAYDDSYLFGDLVCGRIFTLDPIPEGGFAVTEFASGITSLIDGVFGPSGSGQALYYITWTGFPNDQIRRISYTGQANRAPTASIDADPTFGDLPLEVDFDGTGSSDPDEDPLSYEWDFGDGSPTAAGAGVSHTYTVAGTYTAMLTVRDGRGGEDSATVRIDAGNYPPQVTIDSPGASDLFSVGEQIVLSASATDPEDGTLPDSALSWRVERHHADHTHPYLPLTQGNDIPITGPEPEDLLAATNSYLELIVTATDSDGLARTLSQDLDPRLVDLTFLTSPTGFDLELAGTTISAPQTVTSWDNWALPVNAPDQDDDSGVPWVFSSWSDGGARSHTITTPGSPASYTASFRELEYPRPGGATPLRVPLVPAYRACMEPDSTHFPPLASPSCSSPSIESALLTTSSIGVGGGAARLNVIAGDGSTPADEADVAVTTTVVDVRRKSDDADYTDKVLLRAVMRITDKANGPSGQVPATVSDVAISLPIDCSSTPSVRAGATCNLGASLDALVPAFAIEGKRAILAIAAMELMDAGPDASVGSPASCPPTCGTGDEKALLRQGVFAP